ncbi:MAG: M48 family metallopeptidase [Pseudomonadota bacterium]
MSDSARQFAHRGQLIHYRLRRTRRKSLGVYVFPDRRVELRMPLRASERRGEDYIRQCGDWILERLARCPEQGPQLGARYENGSRHYVEGQPHTLYLHAGSPQRVERDGAHLHLYCLEPGDPSRVEKVLYDWHRQRARVVFEDLLERWWSVMSPSLGAARPQLKIRRMKSRWGSCSLRGSVTLNLELMRHAPECRDLVLVHELCHLREFHHGPAFYQLMERFLPDWRQRQDRLEGLDGGMTLD